MLAGSFPRHAHDPHLRAVRHLHRVPYGLGPKVFRLGRQHAPVRLTCHGTRARCLPAHLESAAALQPSQPNCGGADRRITCVSLRFPSSSPSLTVPHDCRALLSEFENWQLQVTAAECPAHTSSSLAGKAKASRTRSEGCGTLALESHHWQSEYESAYVFKVFFFIFVDGYLWWIWLADLNLHVRTPHINHERAPIEISCVPAR